MPAKKRSRPAASRRKPARKTTRKAARKPAPARRPARAPAPKPTRKPARKISRRPARKVTPPAPRKAARKTAKTARKTARKAARAQARAATPKRAIRAPKPRRRARGVRTLPVPPARMRTAQRRRGTRKPKEIASPIVFEDQQPPLETAEAPATPAEISDGEQPDARRYVAVVSEIEGTEPFPAQQPPLFGRREEREEVESYPTDIPIALGSALLAASVFLPWYKGARGFPVSISGWESGTLAPLVVFLAVGSIALVALRRGGAAVSLPVEESLAHEAVGWLALVAAVVKSRWRPSVGVSIDTSYGVWVAIGASALLVVLAGRMSPRAPLVRRPGWHTARGGTVGAALLIAVVAGATAFGLLNSPSRTTATSNPDLFRGTVRDRVPDCAKDFPLPAGLKPELGFDTGATCQAQLTTTQTSTAVIESAKASLNNAKWTFTEVKGAAGSSVFSITKPRCATLAVVPSERGSLVALAYTACRTPTPSATRT